MAYLLVIYILYVILFLIFSVLGLYHLYRYGYIGDLTKPVIASYIIIAISLILLSIVLIALRPWPPEFTF